MPKDPKAFMTTAHRGSQLNEILTKRGLNLSRNDFALLSQVFNPFPDYSVAYVVVPDEYDGISIVKLLRTEYSYQGVVGDLHLVTAPLLQYSSFTQVVLNTTGDTDGYTGSNAWVIAADARNDIVLGPINLINTPAGGRAFPSATTCTAAAAGTNTYNTWFNGISNTQSDPAVFTRGQRSRLICGGAQLVNESATTAVKGSVSAGTYMSVVDEDQITVTASTANASATPVIATAAGVYFGTAEMIDMPPGTIGELATVNPALKTWNTERGVYMPLRIDHRENPPVYPGTMPVLFRTDVTLGSNTGAGGLLSNLGSSPIMTSTLRYVNATAVTASYVAYTGAQACVNTAPVVPTHCVVTGGGDYRYRIVVAYEVFATSSSSSSNTQTPARPSYRPDMIALILALSDELDIACPQDMNPNGEQWLKIVQTINRYLPGAAAALSAVLPEAAPIAGAVVAAGRAAQTLGESVMAYKQAFKRG